MHPKKSRPFTLALLMGASLAPLYSCGSSKPVSTPTQVATPTPVPSPLTVRTSLGATNFTVRGGRSSSTNVDFPPVGTLDVAVDWPGDSNIDLYATDASCAGFDAIMAGACTVLAKAESATALRVRSSSNPFFLRVNVEHKGHFELQGTLDGIDSNVMRVSSVSKGN